MSVLHPSLPNMQSPRSLNTSQKHAPHDFVFRHQIGGNVKNVVKKKTIQDLQAAYRELVGL